MSLVTVQNLAISFLGKTIFSKVGFQLSEGDRVGLVGPNGSGKTTLMRILADEQSYDEGDIHLAKGVTVGYLPQDVQECGQGQLLSSILLAVPGRKELQKRLSKVEEELASAHSEEKQITLSTKLASLHEEQNNLDLRYPPHQAERILAGLGFKQADMVRPLAEFSGGWKMRAALSRLLYLKPDLLLMDEPTNHLDIPSVHWLEGFLQEYHGALVLVCHDRHFLNRQVKRIISFEPEGVRSYSGNYDFYLEAREEEKRILEGQQKNQERQVKEAKRFIERFKAKASKARQANSKAKMLRKMEIVDTHQEHRTIHFSFPDVEQSGQNVLHVEKLSKAFGENVLYRKISLHINRGERIAIIGPNGSGKTTLLRLIAGELNADEGKVRFGHNVTWSYFAQHHTEDLVLQNTVVDEIQRAVPAASTGYIRNVCGAFLFSGDDVDKNVKVLSGGEKARVALARCLVQKTNFMLMDEPTNHLDIHSTEVLIDALADYQGTLLFVSHNQAFVDRLSTRIWDLRDGGVREYPGSLYDYYDFLERRARQAEEQEEPTKVLTKADKTEPVEETAASRKEKRRLEAEKRQRAAKVLGPIKKKIEPIEKRISKLEKREKELQDLLADPEVFGDKEKGAPLLTEYGDVRKKLEELLARWEYLQEELEKKQAEFEL